MQEKSILETPKAWRKVCLRLVDVLKMGKAFPSLARFCPNYTASSFRKREMRLGFDGFPKAFEKTPDIG